MTNLIFRINKSLVDDSYANQPSNFVTVDVADSLIFSAGSAIVINNKTPLPTTQELIEAGILLSPSEITVVPHYFLGDISDDTLKEILLAGNQNKRYVFCCSFDGITATEPQLEAWDDDNADSYALACLGSGVPNSSWYKAKTTTDGLPGAAWAGTALAGSGVSNIILLNNGAGALLTAKDLYFNFKVVVPAGVLTAGQYLPILQISYTSN
jgi:hypothetical protein